MIILGTTNPLLQFLIHISKIEQKMKKQNDKFVENSFGPLMNH
jgi:hypothetical protein